MEKRWRSASGLCWRRSRFERPGQADRRWNDTDLSEDYKMDAADVPVYAFLLALRAASYSEIRAAKRLVDGGKAHT